MRSNEQEQELARAILALMTSCNVAPTPDNYELFYTFASGENHALTRVIGDLIAAREPISPRLLSEIRDRGLPSARMRFAAAEVSSGMRRNLSRMLAATAQARKETDAYGQVLSAARNLLSRSLASNSLDPTLQSLRIASGAIERRIRMLQRDLASSVRDVDDLAGMLDEALNVRRIGSNKLSHERRKLESELKNAIENLGPFDEPISLLICRPDRLDQITDKFGKPIRDRLLTLIAFALASLIEFDNGALRMGDEDFGAVLEYRSAGEAAEFAEKVRVALQGRALVRKATRQPLCRITVSIGTAQYADGEHPEDLLARAEACLDLAERLGGNIVIADTDPLFADADIDAA